MGKVTGRWLKNGLVLGGAVYWFGAGIAVWFGYQPLKIATSWALFVAGIGVLNMWVPHQSARKEGE